MLLMNKGNLLFALSISLGVFILHGFSFFTIAVSLYSAGTALVRGNRAVTVISIIAGGLALLFVRTGGASALLMTGAVFAVLFSDRIISRYLFALSSAAILFSGVLSGIIPLAASLIAASHVKSDKWRAAVLAGGILGVLIIFGPPSTYIHRSAVSEELLAEGQVIWPAPSELNLGMRELFLEAPGIEPDCITLKVYAGGVRDNDPVGSAISGDRVFSVYPGENTLIIEEPEFPISIKITRTWKPFSHPVIFFEYAEASI
ncbi:MAG: hypothetical protein ABFR50_05220 [Candidatus Fermentibacteria bacterium]